MRTGHVVFGSSPAPMPTHPTATIWNGSHGPSPPRKSPLANVPTAPSRKPKPGPNAFPATSTTMNIALKPATNPGSRSATIAAPSTPSRAIVFGPRPPRPSSTKSTAPRQITSTARITGPSFAWFSFTPGVTGSTNGQRNASNPTRLTTIRVARRSGLRRERSGARGEPPAPPPGSPLVAWRVALPG